MLVLHQLNPYGIWGLLPSYFRGMSRAIVEACLGGGKEKSGYL